MNGVRAFVVLALMLALVTGPAMAARATTGVHITVPEVIVLHYRSNPSLELTEDATGMATMRDLWTVHAILEPGHTAQVSVSIVDGVLQHGDAVIRISRPRADEGPATLALPAAGRAPWSRDLRLETAPVSPNLQSPGGGAVILIEVVDL